MITKAVLILEFQIDTEGDVDQFEQQLLWLRECLTRGPIPPPGELLRPRLIHAAVREAAAAVLDALSEEPTT